MPHYHAHDAEAVRARCEVFLAAPHKRVLVHGLEGQPHLNGAIGTLVEGASSGLVGASGLGAVAGGSGASSGPSPIQNSEPDSRVGVALGPPHNKNVAVRRRNLQVSRCATLGETPLIVPPSVGDDAGAAIWALTPSLGRDGGSRPGRPLPLPILSRGMELRNGIAVSRLSVLPTDGGVAEL